MRLVAGLGNPGAQYAGHRHNIGFMAADEIHRRHSFSPWVKKFNALVADGRIGNEKILLIKPQTFMNLSGQSVGEAMRFYKVNPDEIIVLYDELDLIPGKIRVKRGGGSGGHNGIKSLDAHCGQDYLRVRIGIGHPGDKSRVTNYVLGDFAKVDQDWLDPMLGAISDGLDLLIKGDEAGFMNRVSLAVRGPGSKGSDKPSDRPAQKSTNQSAGPAKSPAKGRSHIRQARPQMQSTPVPASGPMAAMLKKLFGGKDSE